MHAFYMGCRKGEAEQGEARHVVRIRTTRVWDDPHILIAHDRHEDGEDRWHAIGTVEGVQVILVVHTYRHSGSEEIVRIIGARRATKTERRRYEQQTS